MTDCPDDGTYTCYKLNKTGLLMTGMTEEPYYSVFTVFNPPGLTRDPAAWGG